MGKSWCWHRGKVIERFTDKHNLCIINDGTHIYLKPQAQHVNKPTSVTDLTISTPGHALRSVWKVLPDTAGSNHYPMLTLILRDITQLRPFPLGTFQCQLWTVSWTVLGKVHWGHPRWSQPLRLLCRAYNQCCKWQLPKGNHHSQDIKPLVRWRMPWIPES